MTYSLTRTIYKNMLNIKQPSLVQYFHNSLFEVEINVQDEWRESIISYDFDTTLKTITVTFLLYDPTMFITNFESSEIRIKLVDKDGAVLAYLLFTGCEYLGIKARGAYNNEGLSEIDTIWSYADSGLIQYKKQ